MSNDKILKFLRQWYECRHLVLWYLNDLQNVYYDGYQTNVSNDKFEYDFIEEIVPESIDFKSNSLSPEAKFDFIYTLEFFDYIYNEKLKEEKKRYPDTKEVFFDTYDFQHYGSKSEVGDYSEDFKWRNFVSSYKKFFKSTYIYPRKEKILSENDLLKKPKKFKVRNIINLPAEKMNTNKISDFYKKNITNIRKNFSGDFRRHAYAILNKDNRKPIDIFNQDVEDIQVETLKYVDRLDKVCKEKNKKFKKTFDEINKLISDLIKFKNNNKKYLEALISFANYRHFIPNYLRKEYLVDFNIKNKTLLIQFEFSNFEFENEDYIPNIELIEKTLLSLMIRNGYLAANYSSNEVVNNIAVNAWQNYLDLSTGNYKKGYIASIITNLDKFKELNLEKIDPILCFKGLNGIAVESYKNINPIKPLYQNNNTF